MKKLIINADDFGMNTTFNKSILELLEEGSLSSTTVMVDRIDESQGRDVKRLVEMRDIVGGVGIGLHIEFSSDEDFEGEIQRQFSLFRECFGFGPTHLDMHKNIYREDGYPVLMSFCCKEGLSHRNLGLADVGSTTTYPCINITKSSLDEVFKTLERVEDGQSIEVLAHPGLFHEGCPSSLHHQREVDILKVRRVAEYAKKNGFSLVSFDDLKSS